MSAFAAWVDEGVTLTVDDVALTDVRAALDRWEWVEALELARTVTTLDARDEADRLDYLAEASWWTGRLDDCITAREDAYRRYEDLGADVDAGRVAVRLWEHHGMKTRTAIAGAWLRRGRRALDAHPDTVEYAGLVLREAEVAHGGGDLDGAEALAQQALVLGKRLGSLDIEAEALQALGRVLIDRGDLDDGIGLLDEAMLSAVEGRLSPYSTGKVHCSMISACEQLGDLRRAAEWTDATLRWSERHPLAMWPGICRVHHAALLQLRGDWPAAEREARRACAEIDGFHVPNVAAGYVEIGEIRRRLGDLDGAEEAFAKAEELCGCQTPGLALVRLAQGRIDAATTIITRMLDGETWNALARAKLLPARVQIAVAAADLPVASEAADELELIASTYASPGLGAAAMTARGRVQLAFGDAAAACATLRQAVADWQVLEVPYELATARLLLGQAYRLTGDEDAATRSLAQAAEIFDRLGAVVDVPPSATSALPAGLTDREAEVLALVASGKTNKQIATALHLSERTVARHLSNIFTKIGATSRTAAAAYAFEHAAELSLTRD